MTENSVASHYSQFNITERILAGLEELGKSEIDVSVEDLGVVDEFHTGGRAATEHLLNNLRIKPGEQALDIGCGIGGTSRLLADRFKVNVHGIDLTSDYIETGKTLNNWVGLADKIDLQCDDATSMSNKGSTFDLATMLHVGMNIKDKRALFSEVLRVLKDGGRFAIYDVMLKENVGLTFPLPWASDASMSFVEPIEVYTDLLEIAGFEIEYSSGRGEFAKSFFKKMQNIAKLADGPPAMGLHLLVGPSIKEKMQNYSQAIFDGIVEPTEIVARKK